MASLFFDLLRNAADVSPAHGRVLVETTLTEHEVIVRIEDHDRQRSRREFETALLEDLERLGMAPDEHAQFSRLLERSHGLILVTGPTGSGKTTSLYAALAALDRERRNILTLDRPQKW